MTTEQKYHDEEKCENGEPDEKRIVVLKRAKCRARIGDVDQIKETRNDGARLPWRDRDKHERFGQLIKKVKGKRNEEDEFHVVLLRLVMSSGVETSLIINLSREQ